jgi:hypothetical protein
MPYLNCPQCGFVIEASKPREMVEHCPRCLEQRMRVVDLFVSAQPRGRERSVALRRAPQGGVPLESAP